MLLRIRLILKWHLSIFAAEKGTLPLLHLQIVSCDVC